MGSGGPLQVAHLPPPTTTAACLQVPINHNQSKERRPQDLTPSPSRRAGTGEHRQPPNRWAIPEHRSGPYRLVKSKSTVTKAGVGSGGPLTTTTALLRECIDWLERLERGEVVAVNLSEASERKTEYVP